MQDKRNQHFRGAEGQTQAVEVFDIVQLMNEQPIAGDYSATTWYDVRDLRDGEIYMICQVRAAVWRLLERDPALVMRIWRRI